MESVIFIGMIEESRRQYLVARIMENSTEHPSGCREWQATKTKDGYGLVHFATLRGDGYKSSMTAHRALYMAHHNIILTRSQWVLHECDNPCCVNIKHLFLGSPKGNTQDKLFKGRNAKKYKLHTRHRVFSDETIIAIKKAIGTKAQIARDFGVSYGYVSKLKSGKAKTLL